MTNPELPKLIEAIYKIKAPAEPRNDLVDVFLKGVKGLNQPPYVRPAEELRLNTSIKPDRIPEAARCARRRQRRASRTDAG